VILYCDTSALLTLFVEEDGSDSMANALEACIGIALCRITWAEMMTAIAQRSRQWGARQEEIEQATKAFN
jgi:uncharacterized protein with PIN domain